MLNEVVRLQNVSPASYHDQYSKRERYAFCYPATSMTVRSSAIIVADFAVASYPNLLNLVQKVTYADDIIDVLRDVAVVTYHDEATPSNVFAKR